MQFKKPVYPGDILSYIVKLKKERSAGKGRIAIFTGRAINQKGEVVAESEITGVSSL